MDQEKLTDNYMSLSNDELTAIAVADYELTEAILNAHPDMAQDAGFELFDPAWAQRYWRKVLSEISGVKAGDKLMAWATSTSIASIANMLVAHYALPAVALAGAVALTIVLVRAAKATR